MADLRLKELGRDKSTSASSAILEVGPSKIPLPNKFPTSSELGAYRSLEIGESFPSDIIVLERLMTPETLKKLLKDEAYFKAFVRGIARDAAKAGPSLSLLFLAYKGEATIESAEDLKTILDVQFFANVDIVTVQRTAGTSPEDFLSHVKFAERWMAERGLDKPLMPIVQALGDREEFERFLKPIMERGYRLLGVDTKGGFYYHALRAIESAKKNDPSLWVHAFQVQPKVRLGRVLHKCSQGMILPYFGVNSFSRWVVPPPPVPLTKDKISFFERRDWGFYKRKDWREAHGSRLQCDCPVCNRRSLEDFFEGSVREVLFKGKVHDHYAQRAELKEASERIKKGEFLDLLNSKKSSKELLKLIERRGEAQS